MNKVIVMPRATSGVVNVTITNEASARAPPMNKPKWGAGSFSAWLRMGLRELRSLIYPQSPHSRDAELGMWGTATPHEVWNSRTQKATVTPLAKENKAMTSPNQNAPEQEQTHSPVDDRIAQAQAEQQQQPQQEIEQEK